MEWMTTMLGAIEGGGTKFVCARASSPEEICERVEIPTTTPDETLTKIVAFFAGKVPIEALGIASFGPIDLNMASGRYGQILNTPKAGWQGVDLPAVLGRELNVPVGLNTDVNCAALGEQMLGAGKGSDLVAYMTVGTGIGVGLAKGGSILQGLSHGELGHMLFPVERATDGACPYHRNCLEGVASGSALRKRWGVSAEHIVDERAWQEEAHFLGLAIANIILALTPGKIIMGGSVIKHAGLLAAVRQETMSALGGYVSLPQVSEEIDTYICRPKLDSYSAIAGALSLARTVRQ